MNELSKVVDVRVHAIVPFRRPSAVAMAAKVRRDHVPVLGQLLCGPIPAAAVIASSVDENDGRCIGVAPVDVMEPQALRDDAVRIGSGSKHGPGMLMLAGIVNRTLGYRCAAEYSYTPS